MRIQESQLQINRWYELNTLPVRAINMEGLNTLFEEIDNLKPIPLTEELLLKCGFERIIVEDYPIYLFDGFMIEIYTDKCVVCYNNIEITSIKFVHSLQNLYFSIKLKELLCDNI